ncbi:hypothetical protein [Ammoniphilus sp. CFH 90114]|uniref:hypothetical protein n=1 Tax=Ammoniphilus sp. CFH 90114 TaxID=2493665 RepID=UPI00100E999F|nr:hypothetical protein [Ammoniphilus sp. CFH 90114]RXT03879.1 hypothetical protein EIZ39_22200 [Ammoniphilus sp. CFH 90114]
MKKWLVFMILTFTIMGCDSIQETQTQENPSQVKSDTEEFSEPEPSEWVQYMKPVREYFYYRTHAAVKGDIQILWNRYPDLKNNVDPKTGVNNEEFEVISLRESFTLIDANFDPESYERIKVKMVNDKEVIVLVHGHIGYLRDDFDDSGGEILIKLFLEQKENQWTVVKTDEYLIHEYKEWLKNK